MTRAKPAPGFVLRLFRAEGAKGELDSRRLKSGRIVVGRSSQADWAIADPSLTISRRHCEFCADGGQLTVRDLSANGIILGAPGRRLPRDLPAPFPLGVPLRLGDFVITAEGPETDVTDLPSPETSKPDRPSADGLSAERRARGSAEARPGKASKPAGDSGSLMDAFWEGAGMDASALSSEEPMALMRTIGAVYREMVCGLVDLMGERTLLKTDMRMEGTRIHGQGNNPFRWASAARIGIDLLKLREGFDGGPDAVRASFADLRSHMAGSRAGAHAACAHLVEALAPEAARLAADSRAGLLRSTAARQWESYVRLHQQIRSALESGGDEAWRQAFRTGYENGIGASPSPPGES